MFGHKNRETDERERREYYAAAAKRFALDAKMFRCRAAVHVENKDDIGFWNTVLKHFVPEGRFHFIAGSRNEYGRETFGVTQCLKYFDFLSPGFFICIDSDYRYLLGERQINAGHFVLQTYTYSFENHHCFAEGLDDVCSRATRMQNRIFDFRRFMREYSHILYDLFMWHLYFQRKEPAVFSQAEFDKYIGLSNSKNNPIVYRNGERALEDLRRRVTRRTESFKRRFPEVDLGKVKKHYERLGVTADTVYLYVRGHNLYDMVSLVCKEVCKAMLRQAKRGQVVSRERLREVYRGRYSVDYQLRQNIKYGSYLPICKIEKDVARLLGKS